MTDISPDLRQQLEKHLETVELDLDEAKDVLQAAKATMRDREDKVRRLEGDQHALQLALGLVDPPVMHAVEGS